MKELKTVESHSVAIKSAEKKTKQVGLGPCYFLPLYIGDKTEKVDVLKLHNLSSIFKRKKSLRVSLLERRRVPTSKASSVVG